MVLGNLSEPPVCFYCGKTGHIKKECFKFKADQARGQQGPGRGNGRNGGRGRGRGRYGGNMMYTSQNADMTEVIRLGLAALNGPSAIGEGAKRVQFADGNGG